MLASNETWTMGTSAFGKATFGAAEHPAVRDAGSRSFQLMPILTRTPGVVVLDLEADSHVFFGIEICHDDFSKKA